MEREEPTVKQSTSLHTQIVPLHATTTHRRTWQLHLEGAALPLTPQHNTTQQHSRYNHTQSYTKTLLRTWQFHLEGATLPLALALCPDLSAVQEHDASGDVQPEPAAAASLRVQRGGEGEVVRERWVKTKVGFRPWSRIAAV